MIPDFGGSGLNIYRIKSLVNGGNRDFLQFADDLTFHPSLLLYALHRRQRIHFSPIQWHEEDQISNVKAFRQSLQLLKMLIGFKP